MKRTNCVAGAMAALTLITACSSQNDGAPEANADAPIYVKVAIRDVNAGTRADNNSTNFQDGTPAENTIKDLRFYFYDANGKRVDSKSVSDLTFAKPETDIYPNVGMQSIQTAIVEVSLLEGSNLPSYVIVVANPIDYSNDTNWTEMNSLRSLERSAYTDAQGRYTMTNSAYYGNDEISGASNVKITGAPIKADQLFTSEEEAREAEDGDVVSIYIERFASKINFEINADGISGYEKEIDGYKISFTPEAWGISADAPSMYAIKRFSANLTDDAIPALAQVNAYLGTGWTAWNDAPLHRSYWACSPGFYATDFPMCSDDIMDKVATGTGAGEVVNPYSLKYYSYNQLTGAADAEKKIGTAIVAGDNGVSSTVRYALENTMGKAAFASTNPDAAAPSAILVGKYTVKYNETALPQTSFCIWNNKMYFVDQVPGGAADGASTIFEAMLDNQQILAIDANGTLLNNTNYQTLKNDISLKVQHPAAGVRGSQALDENFETLQIVSAGANKLYYKPIGSSVYTPVTEDVIENLNRSLAGQLNYAKAYTNGMAYFSIPIQHLRATEDLTNSPFTKDADGNTTKIDWSKVRPGDFGLVRNHVYSIKVNGISGLGNGILNPDAPIVTPMDTYSYYIRYTINILNWRIVPVQGVIL